MIVHFLHDLDEVYHLAPCFYDFAFGCGVILVYRLIDDHRKDKSFYKKHKREKKNDYRPH